MEKKVAQARMMAGSHDAMNSYIHGRPLADGQLFTFIDEISVCYLSNTFNFQKNNNNPTNASKASCQLVSFYSTFIKWKIEFQKWK